MKINLTGYEQETNWGSLFHLHVTLSVRWRKKQIVVMQSTVLFFQYILIKEFQVLYGNCFFKYPKQKASLVKLCICKQVGKHNRQQTDCKATEELSSPGATAVTAEPERTHYHIRLLSELSAGSDSLLVNGEAGNRAVGSAGCCPQDLAARQKALPKFIFLEMQ